MYVQVQPWPHDGAAEGGFLVTGSPVDIEATAAMMMEQGGGTYRHARFIGAARKGRTAQKEQSEPHSSS